MGRSTPEGIVVKAICGYLALQEKLGVGTWWKVRNMTFNANRGAFMRLGGPLDKTGLPDIEGCLGGRYVAFEVKAAKGVQSDGQKQFESAVRRAGGHYFVVKSVDDVEKALKQV